MGPEHVFIIILAVATAGHITRPPASDIHSPAAYTQHVKDEVIAECIAETKEVYFATEDDIGESLEELIMECYDDDN